MTTHEKKLNQIDHINKIIEAIRLEETAVLDMRTFVAETDPLDNKNYCGTSACIAGFSYLVSSSLERLTRLGNVDPHIEGSKFGLSAPEYMDLFFGADHGDIMLDDINKQMAIAALEGIIITGTFNGWDQYKHLGDTPL
jgi:hypothetical protein